MKGDKGMNVNKMIEGNKLTLAVDGRLDTNSSPALLKEFTDILNIE